jgi:hypothetical protein
MRRFLLHLVVLLAFSAYSMIPTWQLGYWGFLDVALAGGWSTQVFVDLAIALTLLSTALGPEARKTGTPLWPYALLIPFLGSIAPLAHIVHREWRRMRSA